jgi:uncharacterized protein (TIGR02117 family)
MAWRWPVRLLGGLAGAVLLYGLVAAGAMLVPVNGNFRQQADGVEVFISSNGVHVDLVLPAETPLWNWRQDGVIHRAGVTHVGFGWGERNFYLNTPRWADFRLTAGVRALLWQRRTLMHVHELAGAPSGAVRLTLSPEQYRRLVRYIRSGFAPGARRRLPGYGDTDSFYESSGTYSAFMTCNEWANRALAVSGVRAALWSPLPFGVMRQAR